MGSRFLLVVALVAVTVLLTGCNGARETDEVVFVIAIGLDRADEGMVKVTYQIAVSRALGMEASDAKQTASTITITAPSLAEARNLLKTTIGRSPNLSHNKVFVIGEEMARQGVADAIAPLNRFREFRGTMYLLTVQNGSAEEFLTKLKPVLEIIPSKYIETMMLTADEAGYYPPSFLHEFYNRLTGKSAAPYTALVAINPMTGQSKPSGTKTASEKIDEYTAGNIPMKGASSPTNFAGMALYKEDKMVGVLTTEETRMFQMLSGDFTHGFLSVTDPQVPKKGININLRLGESPKIKATMVDGRHQFDVTILLEGEVTAIASGINYERPDLREQLEQHVSGIIKRDMLKIIDKTQLLGTDVVGFGFHARRLYPTYSEWEKIAQTWTKDYTAAEINITVKTKIRRTGLMWQTTPIFKDKDGK